MHHIFFQKIRSIFERVADVFVGALFSWLLLLVHLIKKCFW